MDETTLKTVENAVVICAESAKNATESATKALDAQQGVDARIAELDGAIQAAKEDIERAEGFAQTASESAQSANQSAIFANTAKDEVTRIGAQVTTDKALIKGYASTASSGASRSEEAKRIAVNASESVSGMQDEINATKSKIDATAKTVQANADAVASAKTEIDGKLTTANKAITEAVGKAEQAKSDAVKAKESAEIALNNGCVYEVRDVADATIGLDKTLTAYKHTPTGDTSYTFNAPQGAEGKIVVFWLWIKMGETAHALTFPPSVEWLTEPTLGANTETLLALMSVDGGATWTANVQWEA